jgi:hypothetical protein
MEQATDAVRAGLMSAAGGLFVGAVGGLFVLKVIQAIGPKSGSPSILVRLAEFVAQIGMTSWLSVEVLKYMSIGSFSIANSPFGISLFLFFTYVPQWPMLISNVNAIMASFKTAFSMPTPRFQPLTPTAATAAVPTPMVTGTAMGRNAVAAPGPSAAISTTNAASEVIMSNRNNRRFPDVVYASE